MDTYFIHRTGLNFYCSSLFGERTISVPDPAWVRPTIEVDDPAWAPSDDNPEAVAPKITVADPDAVQPYVETANPDCRLPPAAELIELTAEQYQALRDAAASGRALAIGDDGVPCVQPIAEQTPVELQASLQRTIDAAADTARAKVVGDPTRALEYQKASEEAQAFKAAGYPADAVPRTVSAYMLGERTAQEAADSILAEAAAYNEALYFLRENRLAAKERVRQAIEAGDTVLAEQVAHEAVAAIEAAVAGVGNAGA